MPVSHSSNFKLNIFPSLPVPGPARGPAAAATRAATVTSAEARSEPD